MGSWGYGIMESDNAYDFLNELEGIFKIETFEILNRDFYDYDKFRKLFLENDEKIKQIVKNSEQYIRYIDFVLCYFAIKKFLELECNEEEKNKFNNIFNEEISSKLHPEFVKEIERLRYCILNNEKFEFKHEGLFDKIDKKFGLKKIGNKVKDKIINKIINENEYFITNHNLSTFKPITQHHFQKLTKKNKLKSEFSIYFEDDKIKYKKEKPPFYNGYYYVKLKDLNNENKIKAIISYLKLNEEYKVNKLSLLKFKNLSIEKLISIFIEEKNVNKKFNSLFEVISINDINFLYNYMFLKGNINTNFNLFKNLVDNTICKNQIIYFKNLRNFKKENGEFDKNNFDFLSNIISLQYKINPTSFLPETLVEYPKENLESSLISLNCENNSKKIKENLVINIKFCFYELLSRSSNKLPKESINSKNGDIRYIFNLIKFYSTIPENLISKEFKETFKFLTETLKEFCKYSGLKKNFEQLKLPKWHLELNKIKKNIYNTIK